jgi:hypothetical protein
MLTTNTPLPSPPKTPVLRDPENESMLLLFIKKSICILDNLDRRLNDTLKRLRMMGTDTE